VDADAAWERITYFLERVIPVAAEYKIRIACHLHDPGMPPEGYQGVVRVLGTVDGLKNFVAIIDWAPRVDGLRANSQPPQVAFFALSPIRTQCLAVFTPWARPEMGPPIISHESASIPQLKHGHAERTAAFLEDPAK
jgi:hypothetical protein